MADNDNMKMLNVCRHRRTTKRSDRSPNKATINNSRRFALDTMNAGLSRRITPVPDKRK
jgi:hypothetical protein